jgi:hypothetical protein
MSATELHWYRCGACGAVMTTPTKGSYRCRGLCMYRQPLRYLYSTPIVTKDDQLLARGGVVYSPADWLEQHKKKESA